MLTIIRFILNQWKILSGFKLDEKKQFKPIEFWSIFVRKHEIDLAIDWNLLHQPSERLTLLGIIKVELRALKPLGDERDPQLGPQ